MAAWPGPCCIPGNGLKWAKELDVEGGLDHGFAALQIDRSWSLAVADKQDMQTGKL
jgi:hypothetical protein